MKIIFFTLWVLDEQARTLNKFDSTLRSYLIYLDLKDCILWLQEELHRLNLDGISIWKLNISCHYPHLPKDFNLKNISKL